ncbi:MAG TPA: alpha/beta fold hydrolase [Dehalococcoidia bacterium]|nr:alpha/beta fold hydrolase [Dehalococcoidia bacterium]
MPYAKADGLNIIYYEVHGASEGTSLVMGHGMGGTSQQWIPALLPLAERRPLVVWDARGHGRSSVPLEPEGWNLPAFAGDLAGLLDALGVEKAHIGGQSLGGMIAAQFAVDYPERCASILLCDTSAGNGADAGEAGDWERYVQRAIGYRGAMTAAIGLRETMRREFERRMANDPDFAAGPYTIEDYIARADNTSDAAYAGAARAIVSRSDLTDRIGGITAPTLVMIGEKDGFYPCALRDHALIPGSRLVLRTDCGHGFKYRTDVWLTEAEAFLTDVEAGVAVAGERYV